MRGNVLELSVAVIVGSAFGAIVASFTNDIIMPPLGMLLNGVDFSDLSFTLQEVKKNADGAIVQDAVELRYGKFIQKVIDFLIISFAVFILLRTYKKLEKKKAAEPAAPPKPSAEVRLLTEIRDLLAK